MLIRKKGSKVVKTYYLISLLPMGILLSYLSARSPAVVESLYARGMGRALIHVLGLVTGKLPFSLAELLLAAWVTLLGGRVIQLIISGWKPDLKGFKDFIIKSAAGLSLFYFAFLLLWGLNYYRLSFAATAHLPLQPYSKEELANVCTALVNRSNALRSQLPEDAQGVMQLGEGKSSTLKKGLDGYAGASLLYPVLAGDYGQAKGLVFSEPMSYLGLEGVYCPFTGEANVNTAIPRAFLPAVICHEMAHQRGFAREDEANYLAYFTCILNPDPEFQYSGYLLALMNCMNVLRNLDVDYYAQLKSSCNSGVKRDMENHRLYWEKHKGLIEKAASSLNDLYLKSNRQKEGAASYNRMVDLIVAQYRK